jgi:hypothetical protein
MPMRIHPLFAQCPTCLQRAVNFIRLPQQLSTTIASRRLAHGIWLQCDAGFRRAAFRHPRIGHFEVMGKALGVDERIKCHDDV